ncbi:MAG: acylneuraminate cytidylyltransferase family protein, partial [Chloroflexi bacterium]|nr:acylneuraminate cytidylyltransferase family protein [Chloroflexota bacterium]
MTSEMKPLCLIPARGGSKRLPGKNIRLLAGKPLIAYTIEAALDSNVFDCVCVSTDDEEIAAIAREYGADVPFMRPAHLSDDTARVVQVTCHALEFFAERGHEYESLCVLQPTSPLRTANDIRDAYALFQSTDARYVVGIVAWEHPPFWAFEKRDGFLTPHWGADKMLKTQDLP